MKRLIVASMLLLSACGGSSGVPNIQTNVPVPVVAPVVAPMDLGSVRWVVRDLNGLKELVAQMESSGQTSVIFYVLPQDDYNTLAMNLAEMKRYIADQKAANEFLVSATKTNAGK